MNENDSMKRMYQRRIAGGCQGRNCLSNGSTEWMGGEERELPGKGLNMLTSARTGETGDTSAWPHHPIGGSSHTGTVMKNT